MANYPRDGDYPFGENHELSYEHHRAAPRQPRAPQFPAESLGPKPHHASRPDRTQAERQQRLESQRGGYGITPANTSTQAGARSASQQSQMSAPSSFTATRSTPPRRRPLPPKPDESPEESYEALDRRSPSPEETFDYLPASRGHLPHQTSYGSQTALATAAASPGLAPPEYRADNSRGVSPEPYEGGYSNYPSAVGGSQRPGPLGAIDPADIEMGDDDDPFSSLKTRRGKRQSAAGAGGTAATAGVFLKNLTSRDASGQYGHVPAGPNKSAEQSAWLNEQTSGNKRLKWMVGGLIVLVVVLAITGGVVGAILSRQSSSSASSSPSSKLTKSSPRIKNIMNDPNLHKVFQGLDYTPLNTQYPACLYSPPSQDDVTVDVAMLSRLTPRIRLYGTDCNQTEMVLHAIDVLGIKDEVKVWLGVYLDGNSTTNDRQLSQAYKILEAYGSAPFAGIIVGNEVLFSQFLTLAQLKQQLANVRQKLANMNIKLPISTSGIGSNWTTSLSESVDIVMANIHAFFGGVPASQAAAWTYNYWVTTDEPVSLGKNYVISEMGWPSQGGHDLGAVAGINQLNLFLSEWVCQALANGTQYFWFEALDEPWKASFNTKTQHWEPHWGLMDATHTLKPGVKIPDCGGKTAVGWP